MRVAYGNPPYDRWLTNHNKLLNYYEYTIGVKTGFTKKAGRCLVSAAEKDGIRLICVTLNCPDDWNTHKQLYNTYFNTLQLEDLAAQMPQVRIPVTGGTLESVEGICYDKAMLPVPRQNAAVTYDVQAQPFLYAPVVAGSPVGEVKIFLDGQQVAALTLVSAQDVPPRHLADEDPGPAARLAGYWAYFAGGVVIAAVGWLWLRRKKKQG